MILFNVSSRKIAHIFFQRKLWLGLLFFTRAFLGKDSFSSCWLKPWRFPRIIVFFLISFIISVGEGCWIFSLSCCIRFLVLNHPRIFLSLWKIIEMMCIHLHFIDYSVSIFHFKISMGTSFCSFPERIICYSLWLVLIDVLIVIFQRLYFSF